MAVEDPQQPIEQLIANRKAKLPSLRELGIDPYPGRFRVDLSVTAARERFDQLSAQLLEEKPLRIRLAGRVRK